MSSGVAEVEAEALAAAVQTGERRALARAITLVESVHDEHRAQAEALMRCVMPATGASLRIGISGAPGAGKSTLIETLGNRVVDGGHKLAVLAVDPSSVFGGGSILGDKTRMETLARREGAFIRPSPTGAVLGGVARRTREVILLCEAAGYERVLVETVGVGQSETTAAAMTDLFILVVLPGSGDELQGIKRGIIELADLVLVNKADGDNRAAAGRSAADYRAALGLVRARSKGWKPEVLLCSAYDDDVAHVVDAIDRCHRALRESGAVERRRVAQAEEWLWSEAAEVLLQTVRRTPQAAAMMPDLLSAMRRGETTASAAARTLAEACIKRGGNDD